MKVSDIFHNNAWKVALNKLALERKFNFHILDIEYNRLARSVTKELKQVLRVPFE